MAFEQYKRRSLGVVGVADSSVDVCTVEVFHLVDVKPCGCGRDHDRPLSGVGLVLRKDGDEDGEHVAVAALDFDSFHAAVLSRLLGVAADLALVRDGEYAEAEPDQDPSPEPQDDAG
jgi:hypothetical protein